MNNNWKKKKKAEPVSQVPLRPFDPNAVSIEFIKRFVVIHGSDAAGVGLRLKAFADVLDKEGVDTLQFPDCTSALPYLSTGSLFSECVNVIIDDASDVLKVAASSKKTLKNFFDAASTFPEGSRFVLGIPKKPSSEIQFKAFCNRVKESGDFIIREVSIPEKNRLQEWAKNYAASVGCALDLETVKSVISCTGGDSEKIASLIDALGDELNSTSYAEMAELGTIKTIPLYELSDAIAQKNYQAMQRFHGLFDDTPVGNRMFLMKARHVVFDLMLASVEDSPTLSSLISVKSAQYHGNYSPYSAYRLKDQALATGGRERYVPMYLDLCRAIEKTTTSDKTAPLTKDRCYTMLLS